MHYILETERLGLRTFTLDDTAFIIELLNSPGWLQFIGDRNVKTREQAMAYLENGPMKSYIQNGFGLSLVERKEDGIPIGMCGIVKRDTLSHPDIGFAFLPEYNGKGYAMEMAEATLAYARDTLGLPTILAITLPENSRSIRLLEKIGLSCKGTFSYPNSQEALKLFSNECPQEKL
ncbi:MAG: GNAT family N-acetyltransferase [Flavisolibacter sp.]